MAEFKRPEDQYTKSEASSMIKQLKKEEDIRNKLSRCNKSTIYNYTNLMFNNKSHVGTLSHLCNLEKGHPDRFCQCSCGVQFQPIG